MAKKYSFGAVRLLGLLAVVYGIAGIVSSLYTYYVASETVTEFLEFLVDVYFSSSLTVFEMAYYVIFTIFGLIYMFNTKPSLNLTGFNPKAYAMIGFTFLFTIHNVLYFLVYYPFDFSLPTEFSWVVVKGYAMNIYCSFGEILMIIALMNYLRGGKVVRKLLFFTFLLSFIMAAIDGLVGVETLIDAVKASKGVGETSTLIHNISFIVITFMLMMFSFSHDRRLKKKKKVDEED